MPRRLYDAARMPITSRYPFNALTRDEWLEVVHCLFDDAVKTDIRLQGAGDEKNRNFKNDLLEMLDNSTPGLFLYHSLDCYIEVNGLSGLPSGGRRSSFRGSMKTRAKQAYDCIEHYYVPKSEFNGTPAYFLVRRDFS